MASLSSSSSSFLSPPLSKNRKPLSSQLPISKPYPPISAISIGIEDLAQLAHNKALVAAVAASTIGQLAKPLTSAIRGDGIDLKSVVRPGGMPSTHSSSVVAAATSLGLERGFSDSIFGMSVVFAALVMYDAQGVRREAGRHAKILNTILKAQKEVQIAGKSSLDSPEIVPLLTLSEKGKSSYSSNSKPYSSQNSKVASTPAITSLEIDTKETYEKIFIDYSPLNEVVGHTEIQVVVGALLGFAVSIALDMIM